MINDRLVANLFAFEDEWLVYAMGVVTDKGVELISAVDSDKQPVLDLLKRNEIQVIRSALETIAQEGYGVPL